MVSCQTRLSLEEELFLGLSVWWALMRVQDLSVGLDGLNCGLLCPTESCMLKDQCTWCGMRFPRHGKPVACPFGKDIQTEVFFRCFCNVWDRLSDLLRAFNSQLALLFLPSIYLMHHIHFISDFCHCCSGGLSQYWNSHTDMPFNLLLYSTPIKTLH